MKKYLVGLLCIIIITISAFALVIINTNAKTEIKNNTKNEILNVEKEEFEIEEDIKETDNSIVIQTSSTNEYVENSGPIIDTLNVVYGTFGRLYVSGYNVAIYDYNVNTLSNYSLQAIVDNPDSAAYYRNNGKLVIADHYYQGFSVLTYLTEGDTSYIEFVDGSITRYRLIKKSKGFNTGSDLVDTEGNSFFNMDSDIIMYTCYEDGIMATLWVLA